MKKLLSITLSFCLLFAQVVPAWAEVAPLPVQQTSATIQTLVGAEMDQEQAKVFLDAIAQWLQEIENEVNGAEGQTEAFKQLLNGEEPPAKDADEKKLDQQIVQALINIYDKGKPKSAAFQDAFNSTRAKAYLTTLLPSMFSSLEQGTVLHGNAFVFLNDQLSAGGYDACSKEGEAAAAVCEKQLTAADALSGIWSQLTEPEKEAEGLPQLIARTVKGPYATSALQMAIPLVISGQSPGKIFAAEEEQMGVWDVVMEVAGAFSLTNLLTANIPEDLWVKDKGATYYQREGFGNYFNAWTDLGRAWGFKALQDRNSQIAKELNKVVDQLLKGGGLYRKGYNGKLESIYDTVKKIENNKTKTPGVMDQELYYESDKFCPGASIAMKIVINTRTVGDGGQDLTAGDGKIETYTCHNVADPLYPFIVGVFSTGYVPPGYEKKYLLAFLRRSYNRGQEYMGPNTATYMNNLIALGYYTLGGAVPKGVNGKADNYTCQSGASADTMCQRSSAPKDNVERQDAFIAAHRVLSGLDLAMAAYGLFSLGKMIVTGVARARAVIALVKATDKEVKAVYGSWRYVKAAFKATKRANGVDLYKKFVELDKRAAKAMRNIADDADDAAKVADDAAKAADDVANVPPKGKRTITTDDGTNVTVKTDGNGNTRIETKRPKKPKRSKTDKIEDKKAGYDKDGNSGKRLNQKEDAKQRKQGYDQKKVEDKVTQADDEARAGGSGAAVTGGGAGTGAATTGSNLPIVGEKVSEFGRTIQQVDVGLAKNLQGNSTAQAAFDQLTKAGKINKKGAAAWRSIRGSADGPNLDVVKNFYKNGLTVEIDGQSVHVSGTEMEQAMREFQAAIARGDAEVTALLNDRPAFNKCFRGRNGNNYTFDVSSEPSTADKFRYFTDQHLKLLGRGGNAAKGPIEAGAPGAPKFKIKIGNRYVIEIEWQTWSQLDLGNGKTLAQFAAEKGFPIPKIKVSAMPRIQPSDVKTLMRSADDILHSDRAKVLLQWIERRIGRSLTSADIEEIRLRFTLEELYKGGAVGDLLVPPHIHYEVLLKDGTQLNYAVELEGIASGSAEEIAMRNLFTGKASNWNYFENLPSADLTGWLFSAKGI